MRRFRSTALVAAIGLSAGILAALVGVRNGEPASHALSEITRGTFTVQTADAAAQPRMAREQAQEVARTTVGQRLGQTVAGLVKVNGRAIAAADLREVDSAFAPAAKEISSSSGNFRYQVRGTEEDLWVFIFRADGVTIDDWGIANGVVEAQVVVNDQTGTVESANIARYNPNRSP